MNFVCNSMNVPLKHKLFTVQIYDFSKTDECDDLFVLLVFGDQVFQNLRLPQLDRDRQFGNRNHN